jgi:hypothetical protein
MNLVKSLALGSAAAFVGMTAGAQAADLPLAEPVEYVKVCDTYGAGFFYIPGSDTCLLIGGYVRAEFSVGEVVENDNDVKPANNSGFRARARLWFDARTQTEYGTLRSYVRLQFQRDSGGPGGVADNSLGSDDSLFDKAFVQFAGLTAGLTDSFWDFKPYPTFANPFISDRTLAVLAYTADFGGGFSASLGIEDGTARRSSGGLYAEQEFPDFVGNVRVQQGWGEVQLSGFAHQINSSLINDDEWGYGAQLGAKILLPSLAKGDYVWATAAYASGSLSYLGVGGSGDSGFASGRTQNIVNANSLNDYNVAAGDIKKTDGYAFNLGLLHYWSPKWRSAFQGTYIKVDASGTPVNQDFSAYALTTNLIWTPVKKLDIGIEGNYINVRKESASYNLKDDDAFVGRLRIQRDF